MRHLMTTGPPTHGGYSLEGDLHQMADDGGPLAPDPAERSDPEWRDEPAVEPAEGRDNLGELDTFGAPPGDTPAAPADSHWQQLLDRVGLRERWRAACERMVRRSERGD